MSLSIKSCIKKDRAQMNVLSGEISCQVRLGAALCFRNVSTLFLLNPPHPLLSTTSISPYLLAPPPLNLPLWGGRNAFQKVAPFTVKDVGCRPIFHGGLKGGCSQPENRAAELPVNKMHARIPSLSSFWLSFSCQKKRAHHLLYTRWFS